MARQQKNFKLPQVTLWNLRWLQKRTGQSEAEVVTMALDRMYQAEVARMDAKDAVSETLRWEAEAGEGEALRDEVYYERMAGDNDAPNR